MVSLLQDPLTEAKRTIADLKNTNRDFQAQEFLHRQSVCEKVRKRFEHRIQSKDEKIRLLKHEVAMKDEEIRSLKSQQDRREEEYGRLRNNIQSACTDMQNAVATLGSAFIFRAQSPPEKGNDYSYDLIGATPSVGYEMLKYLFKE
ncbi:hypothetical protein OIU84_001262 [Salix udensis]|uniref:Uncharacterized protein n=1 Tax=Salix udensis TaxID=889485 RepID=A0AAD6K731_9ROSI|nr:hypothetical protein OIU84_001262 [Salix udensis]